jgi:tetratricopeptide (TPR) repeat protein
MRKNFLFVYTILTFFCTVNAWSQPFDEKGGYSLEAENFYLQATALHDSGDLETAAEYYMETTNANPAHAKAWYNLALVQYDLDNFAKSEHALEKLMEIDSTDKAAFELYGLTQYQQGRFDRAVTAYTIALEAGTSEVILTNRALAYAKTGRPKEALRDFDEALRLNPGDFNACLGKGIALMELGQHQLAISWFDQALSLRADDALAFSNRAVAYFQTGEKDRAMEDFTRALSKSKQSSIFLSRARCLFADGQFDNAYYDAKEAMLLAPKDPEVAMLMAEIEQSRHHTQEAVQHYSLALDASPNCSACYLERAKINMQNRNFYDAISDLYELIKNDPLNKEARALLQSAYSQLDRENLDWMARSN